MQDAWSFIAKIKNLSQEEWHRYQQEVPQKLIDAALKVETPELRALIYYMRYFWEMFFDENYHLEVKTKLVILAGILYFVLPVDIISDFLPFLGFLDDAFVLRLIWEFIGDEVRRYTAFKGEPLPETPIDLKTLLDKRFGLLKDLFKISPFFMALKLDNKVEELENFYYIGREFFKHNRLANVLRGKLYLSETLLTGVFKELPSDFPAKQLRAEVRGDELIIKGDLPLYNLTFQQKISKVELYTEKERIYAEIYLSGIPDLNLKGARGFLYRTFAPIAAYWGLSQFLKANQKSFPGVGLEGKKLKIDLSYYIKPENLKIKTLMKFVEKLPPLTAIGQNGFLVVKLNE